MNHSLAIKIITLFGFLFLLAMFILYRSGKLEIPFSKESNITFNDTIPRKPDSNRSLKASSSKTMILTDEYKNRTFLEIERKIDSIEAQQKKEVLFSGSKSGAVFTPDKPKIKVDVAKLRSSLDTAQANEVDVIGYSTKRASVFTAKDVKLIEDAKDKSRVRDSILARYKYLMDSTKKAKSE